MAVRSSWPSSRSRWRWTLALAAAAVALSASIVPGLASGAGPSASASSTAALASGSVPFAERAGFVPTAADEATDEAPASGGVSVVLTLAPSSPALFDPAPAGAPPMTVGEVASEFGLSPAAYASLEGFFESRGLTVTHAWPDRLSLSLAGPAGAVGAAFGTSLLTGHLDGRSVQFPLAPPSLPAPFAAEVASVVGLSSGFDPFSLPELSAAPATIGPDQLSGGTIMPSVAREIYDISGLYNLTASPTYATGRGIVLLLWGDGYVPSDLSTFYSAYYPASLPRPTIMPYPIDGAPSPGSGAASDPSNGSREMTLDLEWSGSMAPGATLDAVYAPPGPESDDYSPTTASMVDALNTAVDPSDVPNVAAISMSFGSEDGSDMSFQNSFETDFAVASQEGISLFGATGDLGGDLSSGCTGGPAPEYPSTSPYVVAVGGTSASVQTNPLGGITGFSETAWSEGGGGYSTVYAAPSWQLVGSAAAPIEAHGSDRGTPDVSATADDDFLYFDGQMLQGDGTSFATPLWAGMVTEMDALGAGSGRAAFGMVGPRLYTVASTASGTSAPFHDITSGSNCVAAATTGWDAATGWGSPSAVDLYEHLVSTFVNLTIAARPSPVAPGGTVSVTAVVANATTGAPIAGLAALVTLASTGLGGPCAGTFGSSEPTTNATGAISASFTVSGCYLGSSAVATVKITSGGYFAQEQVSIAVNLLGFVPSLAPLATYPTSIVFFVVLMAVAITIGAILGRRPSDPVGVGPTSPPPPGPPAEGNGGSTAAGSGTAGTAVAPSATPDAGGPDAPPDPPPA
jgi:kumamolisin